MSNDKIEMSYDQYEIKGDSSDRSHKDISHVYKLQPDENLFVNWRIINKETGRTMVAFAGGMGLLAAQIVKEHLEKEYLREAKDIWTDDGELNFDPFNADY
jgi:hypothetical protein